MKWRNWGLTWLYRKFSAVALLLNFIALLTWLEYSSFPNQYFFLKNPWKILGCHLVDSSPENVIICITPHLCSKYSFRRDLQLSHWHKMYLVGLLPQYRLLISSPSSVPLIQLWFKNFSGGKVEEGVIKFSCLITRKKNIQNKILYQNK